MEINHLFPTPVVKFKLDRNYTSSEIAFVDSQPTYMNTGNVTSNDTYVLKSDAFSELFKFAESCVSEYLKTIYAPKNGVSLRITQSWFNYTKEGQFHHKHSHANSFISGVLYIKANPEKDRIYFYKERYEQISLPTEQFNLFNSSSWWIPVAAGDLVLFPSSLTHMVETVKGDDRVSLAFNTFPVGYVGEESSLTGLYV